MRQEGGWNGWFFPFKKSFGFKIFMMRGKRDLKCISQQSSASGKQWSVFILEAEEVAKEAPEPEDSTPEVLEELKCRWRNPWNSWIPSRLSLGWSPHFVRIYFSTYCQRLASKHIKAVRRTMALLCWMRSWRSCVKRHSQSYESQVSQTRRPCKIDWEAYVVKESRSTIDQLVQNGGMPYSMDQRAVSMLPVFLLCPIIVAIFQCIPFWTAAVAFIS